MATLLEYAYLCNDVYTKNQDGTYIDKYYRVDLFRQRKKLVMLPNWVGLPETGAADCSPTPKDPAFFARLYANILTNETIIAYRGTVPTQIRDYEVDIKLAEKLSTRRNNDARHFYHWALSYLQKQQFSHFPKVTGHSLGGYLAQLIAIENRQVIAVVFNAPGIGGFTDPVAGYINPANQGYKKNIYNIEINYDIIHDIGKLIGNVQQLPGDYSCYINERNAMARLPPALTYKLNNTPVSILHNGKELRLFIKNPVFFKAGYCAIAKEHGIEKVITALKDNKTIANTTIF